MDADRRTPDEPDTRPHPDVFTPGVPDPELAERLRAALAELSELASPNRNPETKP